MGGKEQIYLQEDAYDELIHTAHCQISHRCSQFGLTLLMHWEFGQAAARAAGQMLIQKLRRYFGTVISGVYTGTRPIVFDISLLHNRQGDKL